MGNISLGHSSALDASGKLHQFRPGEELPEWVTTKRNDSNSLAVEVTADASAVSESVSEIIARAQAEALAIVEAAKAEAEQIRNAGEPVNSADDDVSDETSEIEESGEPDFTKPAPTKRGRPAKTQA